MTTDGACLPVIAFVWIDPNGTLNRTESLLQVVRWDGAQRKWSTPVTVDTVGDINTSFPTRQVSLAYDRASGLLGLAYTVGSTEIRVATSSNGGQSWTHRTVNTPDLNSVGQPVWALTNGTAYLAYRHDYDGPTNVLLLTGTLTSGFGAPVQVPGFADTARVSGSPLGLQLDSEGRPALAYMLTGQTGINQTLAFWRPGVAQPVTVTDSNNFQEDFPTLSLAFDGTRPRLAYILNRDNDFNQTQLWVSASNDGNSWSQPLRIPADGGDSLDDYTALAINNGDSYIATYTNGSNGIRSCGQPKLSHATNFVNWTTCSPDNSVDADHNGPYENLLFTPDGKLELANKPVGLAQGVQFWRAP
ncbi:MAG: hypothetical protein NVSMB42_00380 [Herpetosiphon sp.]